MSDRRSFSRPISTRRYKKLFILATEGKVTESSYFSTLPFEQALVRIKCLKSDKKSSPPNVLKRLEKYLNEEGLKATDEAWLLVDKDTWNDAQLKLLLAWTKKRVNRHLALSNPKFEYWLLLHFEDGRGISSKEDCDRRLEQYLPNYNKALGKNSFSLEDIKRAIQRAKTKDIPPCEDWPSINGTTVYRLLLNIIAATN